MILGGLTIMTQLPVPHPGRSGFRRHRMLLAWVCLLGWIAPGVVQAEERSTWQTLPEETLIAARIPGAGVFMEALRERTKLGAVVFSEERFDRIVPILEKHDSGEWRGFVDELGDYGLTPGDLIGMLAGESGAAVLLDRDVALGAMPVGMVWVDPGEDLAMRTYEAVVRAVKNAEGKQDQPYCFEMELEQSPVMHCREPVYEPLFETDTEWFDNFDQVMDEQQEQFRKESMSREDEEGKRVPLGYRNMLVARLGGRLIAIANFEPESLEHAAVTAERLTSVMARCLAAHRDDNVGFVAAVESTEGVAEALPGEGICGFEVFLNVEGLVGLASEAPEVAGVLEPLGLHDLGIAAMRMSLDGNVLRIGTYLEAPAPRAGLVKLLEQPALDPAPPGWVPRQLLSYAHLSADLGSVYQQIKATVLTASADAQPAFAMAENFSLAFAQADLATILSAFGHKHMFLQFEPSVPDVNEEMPVDEFNVMPRLAIAWQLQDSVVIQRLIDTSLGMMEADGVETGEEQGFRVWRVGEDPAQAAVMIGKGYMVATFGDGVMESVLAALNNPPQGEDALRSSSLFAAAANMSKLEPGVFFQIADGNRSAGSTIGLIMGAMEQAIAQASDPDLVGEEGEAIATLLSEIQDLVPKEEQWRGAIGVGTGYGIVNDYGAFVRGETLLPAP